MRRSSLAYTLFELMLALVIIAGATVGVLRLASWTAVKADTQKEQRSISALVDAVRGVYATAPSYEGVDIDRVVKNSRLGDVERVHGVPVSAFGGALTLRAATVEAANDAFAVQIGQLRTKDCASIIPALAGQTVRVSTATSGNIQERPHVVPNGAAIAKACAGAFFQQGNGSLTLVYYRPRATGAAVSTGPSCATSCAPRTEYQTVGCPAGLVGQMSQERMDTCSTDACPVPIVGAWTTVSSSCAVAPPPPLPIVPIVPTDPRPACVPRVETRSIPCPQPQVGNRTQQQKITCDAGGAHVGAWTTVYDTCLAPSLPCMSGVIQGTDACAAGQFGQVTWFKELTCGGGGLAIGPKKITGSSCSPIGTCRPSSRAGAPRIRACPAGQVGQITDETMEYSTCASATAAPIWGVPQVTGTTNTCADSIPGPVTNFEIGFWGGYWWNRIKTGWGTCNAPVEGTNPSAGGSTGFNSWILFNTADASAAITDHYIVTMSRKGVTKTVSIPVAAMGKNAKASAPDRNGRQYWYQSWGGIIDVPTVIALTPDVDWSQLAYDHATGNTITPEMCAATVSIAACNSAGQCSAPTTQTDGISTFSNGQRDCQAFETGSVPPWPATARQCTTSPAPPKPSPPKLSGCGDPCSAHGGSAGWFTGEWMRPGVPMCVAALPWCEPADVPACPWPGGGPTAPSWCSPAGGGWHCDVHNGNPARDYACK